jgi:thiosulfate/3-mercaptopyruvate sulfurtransferase
MTRERGEAPRPKGHGFPVRYFLHIVPLNPALKGETCRALAGHLIAGGLCLLFLTFPASPLFAKTLPVTNLEHPRLIETSELLKLVDHPLVRIVDMRSSLLDYLKGHIPNAVYLHFENLRVPENGVPAQAVDRICLERLLGNNLSVSNDMLVVLYSERSNPNATFLAWYLDFLGHNKTTILNGGWEKWGAEALPTTQDYPSLAQKKFFGKIRQETLAEKKWLWSHLTSKDIVIVDARPPGQYSGEEGEEVRRGHIPGARNVFWETTLQGDHVRTWQQQENLQKLFTERDITKNKEIVVHCRTGREASHVYFTLKHILGYPRVRLYRGSWVEWSADKSLPVKTGMEP